MKYSITTVVLLAMFLTAFAVGPVSAPAVSRQDAPAAQYATEVQTGTGEIELLSLPIDGGTDVEEELHYDGDNTGTMGINGVGLWAVRITPGNDYTLKAVRYFQGINATATQIRIYDQNTTSAPGAVLHSQDFTATTGAWNRVDLTITVSITSGRDVWIGIYMSGTGPKIGRDAGPSQSLRSYCNYGGSWYSGNPIGGPWPGNMNIRAVVEAAGPPPPGSFELSSPANGAGDVPLTGQLVWAASAGAENYEVYLKEGGAPAEPGDKVGDVVPPTTAWTYTGSVENDKTYYWFVVATNAGGSNRTKSTSTYHFTTIVAAPAAPALTSPADGATGVPISGNLDWSSSPRASEYDVYLDQDDPPTTLVGTVTEPATEFAYDPYVACGETYYWKVVAKNVGGEAGSEVWHFTTIVAAPEAPVLVAPENGAPNQPVTGSLDWNSSARADEYDVYLDENPEPTTWRGMVTEPATEFAYDPYVACGETYYWKVVAKNVGGEAPSEVWQFSTIGALPPWPESWSEAAKPMPPGTTGKPVKDGGWLALGRVPGSQGSRGQGSGRSNPRTLEPLNPVFYVAKGNKTTDFFRYYPVEDSWVSCKEIPTTEGTKTKPPSKGCVGVSDGGNYVYMTKGNNTLGFWRYNVEADTWEMLPEVPLGPGNKKVKGGTDMVYVPGGLDTGWVYLLKGYKTEFYRYNTATETWDLTLPDAPAGGGKAKYDKGSFLVYDPAGSIYAHQAKYYDKTAAVRYHYMFRYDLGTDRWTDTLKGMPLLGWHGGKPGKNKKSKDGAAGVWYAGDIYTLKGGNTQQFFQYSTQRDSWQELDTIPAYGSTGKKKYVKYGGDMVSFGYGIFFALKGNKTFEMWRYVIPADGLQPTAHGRTGVMAGSGLSTVSRMLIAPNPLSSGFATVRFSLPKAGPIALTVFDIAGRSVFRQSTIGNRQSTMSLDLRKVPAGVYLVRFDAEGYTATQKLVVQR